MTRPCVAPAPPRLVLSWDAATTATVAIARLTITILFAAGLAAHAVVFLALPVGILYDIRRTVAKSMDVARATVAHSRATVRATGCHPPLPPVGYAAAASAYVATVAAHAATSESVVNRTAAGLAGLFGDGFTAAAAALTPTHWGMCIEAAVGMADSERVVWLPIGGEMVATAIGRTLAAGVAALGPVTTMAASMAASFWIFPSLSASALMLSGVAVAWRISKTVDKWAGGTVDKWAGGGAGGRGEGGIVHDFHSRRRGPMEWEDARFADTWRRRRSRARRAVSRPADKDAASAGEREGLALGSDGREAAASPAVSPVAIETEAGDSPRSSDGAQSLLPAAVATAVHAAPTVGWVRKLMAVAAGKGRQCRILDDKGGPLASVDGGKSVAGGHGRVQRAPIIFDGEIADDGGSGRHRLAVVASDGGERRPVTDECLDVTDDGTDGDSYDDEWDCYNDGDAAADDIDYPTDDDDDDDVGDDKGYATDDNDHPAEGDDWNERGWWEAQHPVDRVAADRRRRPAGSPDRRRCADDDAGAIPSDGEAVAGDARGRSRPRRGASQPPLRAPTPPPPLPLPPPPPPPTVPRAVVAPRRTSRRRAAARR